MLSAHTSPVCLIIRLFLDLLLILFVKLNQDGIAVYPSQVPQPTLRKLENLTMSILTETCFLGGRFHDVTSWKPKLVRDKMEPDRGGNIM